MKRYFGKLVLYEAQWGFNFLIFDTEAKTVEQKTPIGGQTASYTSLTVYGNSVSFTINTSTEVIRDVYEMTKDCGEILERDASWNKLMHGLKIKSPRTIEWLRCHGVQ